MTTSGIIDLGDGRELVFTLRAKAEERRPRFVAHLESQEHKIIRDKSPKAIDEAEFQIKAYVDFCRISGRYLTTDPNKLPAKLLECDWVTKLHELVKPQMESWKYDPVYDDELHSHWLVELYYWEMIYDGYKCKRQENRIVFDGEEYRKVNSYSHQPQVRYQGLVKQYPNPGKL